MKTILIYVMCFITISVQAQRKKYSGDHHTTTHGGSYGTGSGSSHKGGHYNLSTTGNHYGRHKK